MTSPPVDPVAADADRKLRRAGWRLILHTIRPQRAWVVSGVAAGVVWTAAKLVVPLIAASAIDDGMRTGDQAKVVAAMIDVALAPDPPRRLLLGSDAYRLVRDALPARLAGVEAQKDRAASTDVGD